MECLIISAPENAFKRRTDVRTHAHMSLEKSVKMLLEKNKVLTLIGNEPMRFEVLLLILVKMGKISFTQGKFKQEKQEKCTNKVLCNDDNYGIVTECEW